MAVPTDARPYQLGTCLQSLSHFDYSRNRFEVIAVDDGSETPVEAGVTSFHGQLDLTLLTQPHAGPAAARNTGAAQAKGRFLAFADDDCIPAPDWLQALAASFANAPDHAVGGQTLNALLENFYSTASQLIVDIVFLHCNANPNQACFFAINNLANPAGCFRVISGFDATSLCFRREIPCSRTQGPRSGPTEGMTRLQKPRRVVEK